MIKNWTKNVCDVIKSYKQILLRNIFEAGKNVFDICNQIWTAKETIICKVCRKNTVLQCYHNMPTEKNSPMLKCSRGLSPARFLFICFTLFVYMWLFSNYIWYLFSVWMWMCSSGDNIQRCTALWAVSLPLKAVFCLNWYIFKSSIHKSELNRKIEVCIKFSRFLNFLYFEQLMWESLAAALHY